MNRRGTHITVRRPTAYRKRVSDSTTRCGWVNPFALVPCLILIFFVIGAVAQLRTPTPDSQGDSSESSEGQSKTIKIDADRPLTKEFRRLTTGGTPPAQTDIEFNGAEDRPWTFVKFDELPEHTSITLKGKAPGYEESEPLEAKTWYPFKTKLPIVFTIDAQVAAPVALRFWFGSPKAEDKNFTAKQSIEKVRALAQESVSEATNVQVITFQWGPSVVAIEPASLSFAPNETSKTVTLTGDSRTWTMLRFRELPTGIQAIINTSSPDDLTSKLQTKFKDGEWIGFRGSATLDLQLDRKQLNTEVTSADLDIEIAVDRLPSRTKDAVSADIKAEKVTSSGSTQLSVSWGRVGNNFWLIVGAVAAASILLGAILFGLWRRSPDSSPRVGAPRSDMKVFNPFGSKKRRRGKGHKFEDAEPGATPHVNPALILTPPTIQQDDLDRLRRDLLNQISQLKGDLEKKLSSAVQNQVTSEYVKERVAELDKKITALSELLNGELQSVRVEVSRLEQAQEATKPDLANLQTRLDTISVENVNWICEIGTQLKNELDELHKMVVEQAFPESYFARTMGMILSKNILDLHEGNLERLIGEAVNSFFQADVPRAESLQDLRQRAESIIATLKNVLEIVSSKKPEVEHEVRLRVERAEALLAKISGLQNQLQSRKLTLETTLTVPVSAYPGARQTFIEELGRGIRSELDKLADPQNYFEGDLERLVTADLIAIVDICDKKVSLPVGSDSEVESLLQQLFQQAGLRPILPSSGEPFGTAEQDLVQMVQGAPGTSMTVAEVVLRGFYYTHRANETLLRKAGVTVYR